MDMYISICVSVLSYAFQVAGALILLLWCIGNLDKKVKQNCLNSHSEMLWGAIDESGGYTELSAEDLQESAKNIYLNIAAFADLVIGYALAIFMTDVAISPLYILLFVALAVVVILCTEYCYILKKAKEKYPSAQKVYDSDVKLKTGTIKIFPAETEKENN